MPSYPFHCQKCDDEFDLVMTIPVYSETEIWDCQLCEGTVTKDDRILCAANVTRASFVDGTKRPGFSELKEAHKLKVASYNMKPEDRGDINKVIKDIEKRK
jgi:hypothetical protein